LPAPDGKTAHAVACPGKGNELVIRRVTPTGVGRAVAMTEKRIPLNATPAGPPALVGKRLMLPITNKVGKESALLAVTLDPWPADALKTEEAPNLRADLAGVDARSYVLALDGERYLTSDGLRGLHCWKWAGNERDPLALPEGRDDRPTLALKDRIAAPPVLVPGAGGPRIVVADAVGLLHLLSVRPDGSLREERTWDLAGRITGAPFVRTLADGSLWIGCVVDETNLVWLDPARAKEVWRYTAKGALVGRPVPAGDVLVVADQSGQFVAVDPKTGKEKGPGYLLKGTVVPSATPVPFGPDRWLAPLSDGTALLLSRKRLVP
jgi:hypothetical protein